MITPIEARAVAFKQRIDSDEHAFCNGLFQWATTRLLAFKYLYYKLNQSVISDLAYDLEEKDWYMMGRTLSLLAEDETSPCIDFDIRHPVAKRAMKLAYRYMDRRGRGSYQ